MSLPEDYRDYFIRNLHDALSGHASNNGSPPLQTVSKKKKKKKKKKTPVFLSCFLTLCIPIVLISLFFQ
jgi:hypothetical protein